MGMWVPMAAMMLPTAAPFFFAYGRDSRRPAAVALLVLIYVAVWMAIGLALDYLMSQLMMPPSSLPVVGIAVALALVYAVSPWSRWARAQCRQMSMREPRGPRFRDALADGARYATCCVVCSAGVMLVVIVLGMSNPVVVVAGAAVMVAYKLIPWPQTYRAAGRAR
jgi:predicted metal-binding membrane protein